MRRVGLLAAILLCVSARPARASGHLTFDSPELEALGVVLFVLGIFGPSDLGALIPAHDQADETKLVLGWSFL
jgi:hypothetical protein